MKTKKIMILKKNNYFFILNRPIFRQKCKIFLIFTIPD